VWARARARARAAHPPTPSLSPGSVSTSGAVGAGRKMLASSTNAVQGRLLGGLADYTAVSGSSGAAGGGGGGVAQYIPAAIKAYRALGQPGVLPAGVTRGDVLTTGFRAYRASRTLDNGGGGAVAPVGRGAVAPATTGLATPALRVIG